MVDEYDFVINGINIDKKYGLFLLFEYEFINILIFEF